MDKLHWLLFSPALARGGWHGGSSSCYNCGFDMLSAAAFVLQCIVIWFAIRLTIGNVLTKKGFVIFAATASCCVASLYASVFIGPFWVISGCIALVVAYAYFEPQRKTRF